MDPTEQMVRALRGTEPGWQHDPSIGILDQLANMPVNQQNWGAMLEATPPSNNIEDRRGEELPQMPAYMQKPFGSWTEDDLNEFQKGMGQQLPPGNLKI